MTLKNLDEFIMSNFGGVGKDCPWEGEPEFVVYRHTDNHKWFGLLFYAKRGQLLRLKPGDPVLLRHAESERIDILNVKAEPEMIPDIVQMPGILPGYHMNRAHWVSIILNADTDQSNLKALVEMSYNLTAKRYRADP